MPDAKRIYELMVLTIWADGKAAPSEVLEVHRIVSAVPGLQQVATPELAREMKARIDEKGFAEAVREAASGLRDRSDRELAFRYCARVLDADGDLSMEEAEVLGTLQELFELSGEDVQRLMANLQE